MQLTKSKLTAYQARWQVVADVQASEARAQTTTARWQQLNALLRMAAGLGLASQADQTEIDQVRQRWLQLKEQYLDRRDC